MGESFCLRIPKLTSGISGRANLGRGEAPESPLNVLVAWRGAALARVPPPLATFVSSLVRPKYARTSGSRERPIGSQLCGQGVNGSKAWVEASRWIISREPPVAGFCGRMEAVKQISRGWPWYVPNRLPSRRGDTQPMFRTLRPTP